MCQLVQIFYSGLDVHNRQMVDASCGDSFLYKTPEEAWELSEHLSKNSHLHAISSHFVCLGNYEVKRGFMRFHIQLTFLVNFMLELKNLINCCA